MGLFRSFKTRNLTSDQKSLLRDYLLLLEAAADELKNPENESPLYTTSQLERQIGANLVKTLAAREWLEWSEEFKEMCIQADIPLQLLDALASRYLSKYKRRLGEITDIVMLDQMAYKFGSHVVR